jgi:phage gp36-like protein
VHTFAFDLLVQYLFARYSNPLDNIPYSMVRYIQYVHTVMYSSSVRLNVQCVQTSN